MMGLALFILLLQVVTEGQCSRQRFKDWTLTAPSKVLAMEDTCVVIPCSYTFPKTSRTIREYRGFWRTGGGREHNVAVTRMTYSIYHNYRGRTQFIGSVWRGNCSWVLDSVKASDSGLYFFRVEMPRYTSFSWSFQPTQIQVIPLQRPQLALTMNEVTSQSGVIRDVVSSCFVVHSCPLYPPDLVWSHNGTELQSDWTLGEGQWGVSSALSFSPSEEDFTRPLTCTAHYHGGLEVSATVVIVKRIQD